MNFDIECFRKISFSVPSIQAGSNRNCICDINFLTMDVDEITFTIESCLRENEELTGQEYVFERRENE